LSKWKRWSRGAIPNYIGGFATNAVNDNVAFEEHVDRNDEGMCMVAACGDFAGGGNLVLEDFNLEFKMGGGGWWSLNGL
jgi:hypothetical protein